MQDNNLSMEDLNQLVTSRGQKPIEQNEQYQDIEAVETVANEILQSAYAEDFKSGLEMIPNDIRNQLSNDPRLLSDFAGDYESGIAQKIMPEAEKLMAIKGLDFFTAYMTAGQSLMGGSGADHSEPTQTPNNRKQTLRAAPRGNTQTVKQTNTQDVFSLDEKSFDKYFENM